MDANHNLLLGQLAQDYYLSKLSINDMTKKYQLSRYLILKYLDEALANQIVTININAGINRNSELERKLKEHFAINNLYVVKSTDTTQEEQLISSFAAHQIQAAIQADDTIGVAWGETVYSVIDEFKPTMQQRVRFTQFTGENMKYQSSSGSMRMVQKAAAKYNAPYYVMPGPIYIANDLIREQLPLEPAMQKVFAISSHMNMLISGVGTLASLNSIQPWRDAKDLLFPGVDLNQIAGMIYGRPYDINGQLLNQTNDKTFGIEVATLQAVPKRFGIVKRKSKAQATLGALRGNFFTDLIITEAVALLIMHEIEAK